MIGLLFGPPKAEACCTYAQNPPRYCVDHTRKLVRPRARNLFLPPPHFNLLLRPDAPHGAHGALVAGTTPKSIRVASFETSARLAFRFSRPLVTSHPTFRDTSSTGSRFWELESWALPPGRTVGVGEPSFSGTLARAACTRSKQIRRLRHRNCAFSMRAASRLTSALLLLAMANHSVLYGCFAVARCCDVPRTRRCNAFRSR